MLEFLQRLGATVGHLGSESLALVPAVGVVLVLAIAGRLLNRQAEQTRGLNFRNQLIMAAATFVGGLAIVILLPVDAALRGQLLTLLGLVISVTISLSSTTFLGNAMAGIMLKAVRNFRSGDFVQVGEHFGRVTERGLFHTEIQTANRDLTTLPNLYLATTPITVVRTSGTIVDATVSLGFEVPHARIESLLLDAVREIELGDPFVQVLELGNFSVTYRVGGLLTDTKRVLTYRSRLRVAVLDALHGGGIEIVSPEFRNVRAYDPGHEFMPAAPSGPSPVAADAPVDVIFDKAEEAESLETLRQHLTDLVASTADLQKSLKEAGSSEEKEALQARLAQAEKFVEKLTAQVAAAESREESAED